MLGAKKSRACKSGSWRASPCPDARKIGRLQASAPRVPGPPLPPRRRVRVSSASRMQGTLPPAPTPGRLLQKGPLSASAPTGGSSVAATAYPGSPWLARLSFQGRDGTAGHCPLDPSSHLRCPALLIAPFPSQLSPGTRPQLARRGQRGNPGTRELLAAPAEIGGSILSLPLTDPAWVTSPSSARAGQVLGEHPNPLPTPSSFSRRVEGAAGPSLQVKGSLRAKLTVGGGHP